MAYKNDEVKVSYLLCDLEQNGQKRIVVFSSNSRSTLQLPEPYHLLKMSFKDFLMFEYDFKTLNGIIINPYHESIVLNNTHLDIMMSALINKIEN